MIVVVMEGGRYGSAVRRRRLSHQPKMSQQKLADAVGVDRTHIVHIESGRIGLPQDELRGRIAEALSTTDEELLLEADAVGAVARRSGQLVPSAPASDSGEWVTATDADRAEMRRIVDEVGLDDLAVLLRIGRRMPRGRG